MILVRYRVAPSPIEGAGNGLFLDEDIAAGRVMLAPDAIDTTYALGQIDASEELAAQRHAMARWFEDRYTLSPDWPDECFVNHSFTPTGLWHLGFVFALENLPAGTEITVDYRHLLPPGEEEAFIDSATGGKIIGLPWPASLAETTHALARLLG